MSTALPRVNVHISRKSETPSLWMVKPAAFKGTRRNVPGIVPLLDQIVKLTKDWQYFIRAINPGMSLHHVAQIFEYKRAFSNNTAGFGNPTEPHPNYLTGEDLDATEPLRFDKVRTCIRATHTGEITGDYLWLTTMDGDDPPPLKHSRRRPRTLDEIRLDDYLWNPREHRWMFFACVNYGSAGQVTPFDHGGVYSWFGPRQVTWLPLVSCFPVKIDTGLVEQVTDVQEPYWP